MTYAQAAAFAQVSTKTVKEWVYSGRLATFGEGRIKRVKSVDVRACLTEGRRPTTGAVAINDTVTRMIAKAKR